MKSSSKKCSKNEKLFPQNKIFFFDKPSSLKSYQ